MGAALRDDYPGWLAPSGNYPVAVPDYEEPWDSPELVPAPHAPQITSVRPTGFESARIIGEHVRVGTPVIMDLTEMTDGDAKRLVDFASGLVFGMLMGKPAAWAVACGVAHGALAMTTPGDTSTASRAEVERVMLGGSARIAR